jgi:hypothetical protein
MDKWPSGLISKVVTLEKIESRQEKSREEYSESTGMIHECSDAKHECADMKETQLQAKKLKISHGMDVSKKMITMRWDVE